MMLAMILALAAAPQVLPLMDETVTVPAADWKAYRIPLHQRSARIECHFSVVGGGSGIRVMLLERSEFAQLNADRAFRPLAATAYQRSGAFAYPAQPDDYTIVLDNRMEGRGPSQVRLQVALVFGDVPPARAAPRQLSPGRQAAVIALSVLFFAAVLLFAGRRLLRAFRRRPRPPAPPFGGPFAGPFPGPPSPSAPGPSI